MSAEWKSPELYTLTDRQLMGFAGHLLGGLESLVNGRGRKGQIPGIVEAARRWAAKIDQPAAEAEDLGAK